MVCTALEELNTEDEMPDEIEISEEEFLFYQDLDSELNFVCLEDYESGSCESDERGKYYIIQNLAVMIYTILI